MKLPHLIRRFFGSIVAKPLTDAEQTLVGNLLLPRERQLFAEFSRADQRHAMVVLRRFDAAVPSATTEVRRAALLHDIGKVGLRLGVFSRVLATVVGSRTAQFAQYHAHESRGLQMLAQAGSSEVTLRVLRGQSDAAIVDALRNADDT